MARAISIRADILISRDRDGRVRSSQSGQANNLAQGKVVDERTGAYHWEMDFKLEEATPVLERTPVVLSALLDDLPEDWTRVDEGPDTWSPREVVSHLIHGERTDWIPRARIILKQESYRRFDPFDRFAELKSERPLRDLLAEFDELRSGNVATLRGWNMKEKDMELTGEHPEFGAVTMRQLLATWVVHDLSHIAQITRTMARAYTSAVGPWTAYFRVLQRDVTQ
jgi:DinB superfamily